MCYLNKKQIKKGASLIEYIVLSMIILSGLYIMKGTIEQGLFSKYKSTGESYGFGRQYDSKRSTICKTDVLTYDFNGAPITTLTYDEDCYQTRIARPPNAGGCPQCYPGQESCYACEEKVKRSCQKAYCNQ